MPIKRRPLVLISFFEIVACATNLASEQSSPQGFFDTSPECSAASSGDVAISPRNLVQMSMLTGNTRRATNESLSFVDRVRSHAASLSKAGFRLLGEQPVLANLVVVASLLVALVALAWLMSDDTVARPAPAPARTPTLGTTPVGTSSFLPCPDTRYERVPQGMQRSQEESASLLAKLSPRILQEARPSSAMMPEHRLSSNRAGWPTEGFSQREQTTFFTTSSATPADSGPKALCLCRACGSSR